MEWHYVLEQRGTLSSTDAQSSPLVGRAGQFRLQQTSPDWVLFIRHPVSGGTAPAKPRIVLAGDVSLFTLPDLVAFLGQSRWSGILLVSSPGCDRTIVLKDGDVRSAASDAARDKIGEVMVRLGYIGPDVLQQVLADLPPSKIGKALIDRGLLKSHDLFRCLNEQVAEIFHGVMLAREGTFLLIDQVLDERNLTQNFSLSMQGLLMDSIRKIDELAQFRKRIPDSNVKVVRAAAITEALEDDEARVLAAIDNRRTLLELAQAAKVSEFEATRIVHRLMELGGASIVKAGSAQTTHVDMPTVAVHGEPTSARAGQRFSQSTISAAASDERKMLAVFNVIFRDVRDEVARRGNVELFVSSANAALRGRGVSTSPVLNGLVFSADGTLPEAHVVDRLQHLAHTQHLAPTPIGALKQALSDVMYFLLFQAGEILESSADANLAKRVKDLLSSLDGN